MARPRKPPERLQDRRDARVESRLAPVVALPQTIPPVPAKWLKTTEAAWEKFFRSDPAQVVQEIDYPALGRLFTYYDEWLRASGSIRERGRLVAGSKGQPVLNPLAEWMLKLEVQIQRLESQFGITPLARSRLGISFGIAHKTLDDLNRDLDATFKALDPEVIELLDQRSSPDPSPGI